MRTPPVFKVATPQAQTMGGLCVRTGGVSQIDKRKAKIVPKISGISPGFRKTGDFLSADISGTLLSREIG
jgi:hypothetical protein